MQRIKLTLAGLACWAAASHGDTIDEMVVTASPHAKDPREIAGALSLLDRETLQREVAATLGETLHNQLGVQSSSFGPGVGRPVIRGLSGKRVAVLQNNSAVGDLSSISPDHAVATEALLADRIEILRGPATLRYGPGAIGGVVNVIDNRIHQEPFAGLDGAIEARHDGNNHADILVGRLDMGNGPWTLHLDGVTRDSRDVEIPGSASLLADDPDETTHGFIANTDAQAQSWSLGLSRAWDGGAAGVSIQRQNNEYGIPPGGHLHHDEEEEAHAEEIGHAEEEEHHEAAALTRIVMDQTLYQGKFRLHDLQGPLQAVGLDLSHTEYRHRELEIEEGIAEVGTRFENDTSELRAEFTHAPAGDWTGTFGIQASRRDFAAVGDEAFVPPAVTDGRGLFLLESLQWGEAHAEVGVRYDRQSVSPDQGSDIDHRTLNASASLLYPVAPGHRLGLIVSRTERAPTAEELLAEGEHVATNTYEIGDTRLDTETALNLELTWRYEGPVDVHGALYYRDFRDYLFALDTGARFSRQLAAAGASGLGACSANPAQFDDGAEGFEEAVTCFAYSQRDARFAGGELEATIPLPANQSLRLWGDLVDARFDNGEDVPRIPPARLGASWDLAAGPWILQLSAVHGFAQNDPGENQSKTEAYTRLDAYAAYGTDNWSLFVKGTNLTDNDIRNATSFLRELAPEPGRSLVLGANYRF